MHLGLRTATVALLAWTIAAPCAWANENVLENARDPGNWATQLGSYAAERYSSLDQIDTSNVRDLKVAWQFSTGVLRGHEGSPLVVGSVMYVHTPFPNNVFALDLDHDQKIL